jgi:plasmid stabilization system protein ParE
VKLRFTLPALDDLEEILDFIHAGSPHSARKVQRRLQQICELLTANPKMGARTNDPTIRRMVATPYPFLIFYEEKDEEIIVHALRHAARDPASMPGGAG